MRTLSLWLWLDRLGRTVKQLVVLATPALALTLCALACLADNRADRIHHRVDLVKKTAQQWVKDGKNPSQALELMKLASQAFDSGDPDKGESFVDQAMQTLNLVPNGKSSTGYTPSAIAVSNEPVSSLYKNPERVEIVGYEQNAMEPCISLDGQYLFFNGSNEDDIDMHIYYARRISDRQFQYLGLLPDVQSAHRDMAPSLDLGNNLFFTSARSFGQDGKSLYVGHWQQPGVSKPLSVDGDISKGCGVTAFGKPFWINMDCGISPDGKTLIISRTRMVKSGPLQSNLIMAKRDSSGRFNISPESELFLKSVNTPALEYAPAISADGLELYFTRCEVGIPKFRIMVAWRASTDKPFGPPARLAAIEGYSEAPSLTLDKGEMFFHKKDGNLFHIYRVKRSE